MISVHSKNQVVLLPAFGEIFPGVVNDMVCPERASLVQIPSAAHGRDFSTERFGNLHGKRPHPTGCTLNQNLLPRLNVPLFAQTLQGCDGRHGYSCCFLECQNSRFKCQ